MYWSKFDTELSFQFPSANLILYEEYLLYDWIGMIGSIGGSLGLFVGFSFRDFFTCLFQLNLPYIFRNK